MKVGSLEADLILNTQKYKQGIAQAISEAKSTGQQISSALNTGPLQSAKSVGGALTTGLADAGKQAQLTRQQIQSTLAGPVAVSLNNIRNQARVTGAEIRRSLGNSFSGSARVVDQYVRGQRDLQKSIQKTSSDADNLGRQFVTSVVDKLIQTSNQAKQTGKSLTQLGEHTNRSTANVSTQAKELYERLKIANELASMSGHSVSEVGPEDTAFLKNKGTSQDEKKAKDAKKATKAVKENASATEAAAEKKVKASKKEKKAADETSKAAAKTTKTQKQVAEQSQQTAETQAKTTKKKQEAIRSEQQAAASAEDTANKARTSAKQQKAASAEVARATEESVKASQVKTAATTQTQQAVEKAIASEIHLRRKAQEQIGAQPLAAPTEAPKSLLPVPIKSNLPAIPTDFKKVAQQTTKQLEPIMAAAKQVGEISRISVIDPIRSSLGTIQTAASKAKQELQSVETQAKKTGAATTEALSSVAHKSSAVNELQHATGTAGGGGTGGSGGGKGSKPPTGGGGTGGGGDDDDTTRKSSEAAASATAASEKVRAASTKTKSKVKADIDDIAAEAKKKSTEVAADAEKASKKAQAATWALRGSLKDVGKVVSGIVIAQGFYRTLDIVKQAAGSVLDYRRELDSANVSFSTLLGNAEEGKQYVMALQQFALQAPGFTLEETETASRRLLAMGFQANSSLTVLQDIVDMAAIKKDPTSIDRITLALGQVRTAGRLYGQELRQLTEAGIPVDTLQKKLGLSSEQMHNLGKNAVPASKAIAAILSTIHERFGGAAKALSTTTAGLEEMAKERALQLGNQLFDAPLNAYKRMLQGLVQTLGKLSSALAKGGMHGMVNALVGPKVAGSVLAIISSFERLSITIKNLWATLKPFLAGIGDVLLRVLGIVLPVVTSITMGLSWLARKLVELNPAIVAVISRLIGLFVVTLVGAGIMSLSKSLVTLFGSLTLVSKGLTLLVDTFKWAQALLAKNPWVLLITVVIGALIALASSCKYVGDWLDWLSDKLASVGVRVFQNTSKAMDPSAYTDALNKYMQGLEDTMKAEDGVGEAADEAGKKIKNLFVASFDEVFQIPEKMDDAANALGGSFDFPTGPTSVDVKPNTPFPSKDKNPTDNIIVKKPEPEDNKTNDKSNFKWPSPPAVLIKGLEELMILFKSYELAMQKLQQWSTQLSKGWDSLGDSLGELGKSVSGFFGKSLHNAGESISNFGVSLKKNLGNAWTGAMEGLDSISVWLSKKLAPAGDATFNWGKGIGTSLCNGLDAVLSGVSSISGWFGKQFDSITQSISGALSPIGAAIGAFFLSIPGRIRQALINLKNAVVDNWKEILTGIGLVLAAIALAIVVWIGAIPASIAAGCAAIVLAIVGVFASAKVAAAAELDNTKKEIGTKWDNIRTTISEKCTGILEDVKTAFFNMKTEVVNTVTGWASDLNTKFNNLKTDLGNTANNIKTAVSGAFSGLATSIGTSWSGIVKTIKDHINIAIDYINKLITKMNSLKFTFPEKTIMGQKIGGWTIAPIQIPTIAHLAKGGILTKESLFVGGEGGNKEGVIPLTGSGARMVAQALAAEIASSLQATGTDNRPILYVGTLVADDRSLRELNRRMQVVQLQEKGRVVGGGV